jgi:hypothetical protein
MTMHRTVITTTVAKVKEVRTDQRRHGILMLGPWYQARSVSSAINEREERVCLTPSQSLRGHCMP